MSQILGDLGNSITSIASTETATGLVGLVGSLVGIGGMPNLQQYQGLLDAAPDWMWTCDIVNLSQLFPLSNVYVREVNFNYNHVNAVQRYRNGIYQQYPTQFMANPVALTFYEPYNYSISYFLEQWSLLIRNKSGAFNTPNNYMGSMILRLYDVTGLQQLMVQLDGVWPITRHSINLQYQSSGMTLVGCDFSINNVSITYIGTGFSTLLGTNNISTDLLSVGGGLANSLTGGIVQLI